MMNFFGKIVWLVFFAFTRTVINGQGNIKDTMVQHQNVKPHYLRPAVDIFGVNVIINRFDTHIMKVDWSSVSLSSWKLNLERGFLTDGDQFPGD